MLRLSHPRRNGALLLAVLSLAACNGSNPAAVASIGDANRGKQLIIQEGCGACHTIPGIASAQGLAAPPLVKMGDRTTLAGVLANTPDNMVKWLENPQAIVPNNAMPNVGLNDRDAHDITAYLYSIR